MFVTLANNQVGLTWDILANNTWDPQMISLLKLCGPTLHILAYTQWDLQNITLLILSWAPKINVLAIVLFASALVADTLDKNINKRKPLQQI